MTISCSSVLAWHFQVTLAVDGRQHRRYLQNCKNIDKDQKALGYRRVAELLIDLQNNGLVESQSTKRRRGGYGRGYRFNVEPKTVGESCFSEVAHTGIEKRYRGQVTRNSGGKEKN